MRLTQARRLLVAVVAVILAVLGVVVAQPSAAADAAVSRVQLTKSFAYSATTRTTGASGTLTTAATAGNLLVLSVAIDKASGTITWPSGWTNVAQRSGASVTIGVATKVAAGGETSAVTFSWPTASFGYSAMLTEYSGASGVNGSIVQPGTYSDLNVTSLSVNPPLATAGGKGITFLAMDSAWLPSEFSPSATGWPLAGVVLDSNQNNGTPGLALNEHAQHTANTDLPAATFSWGRSDQVQAIELNLTAKQTGVAPTASFTKSPSSGTAPLAVQFTDTSTGAPTSWSWSFGDGGTATVQNPSHTFATAGTYTVTLTATNASGSSSSTGTVTVSAPSGWTMALNQQFDTAGAVPADWWVYDGPYGSDPNNCATPSHDYVSGGSLHLLMKYEAITPPGGQCGAGWYTGGMQLGSVAAVNQRVTLRWREVGDDPLLPNAGIRSHNNMPMLWGDTGCWPQNGEIDYLEGTNPFHMQTYVHYGACGASTQIASAEYNTIDFRQWHTVQAVRLNHTVQLYVDDMTTPIFSYTGTASTVPDVLQRVVLQQECESNGCPASPSSYTLDLQVDWITVETQ